MRLSALLVLLILSTLHLGAQDKVERERRIDASEVPAAARSFVDGAAAKRLRWYREEGSDGTSIEAKFMRSGHRHSVEFRPDGTLQDIEVERPVRSVPGDVQSPIRTHLDTTFRRWSIRKWQERFTGPWTRWPDLTAASSHPSAHELVVRGRSHDGWGLYEVVFSPEGRIVSTRRIVLQSTDHLEF